MRLRPLVAIMALVLARALSAHGQSTVIETLPPGLTPVNVVASTGTLKVTSGTIVWSVSLPPGTTATLTYDVVVETTACHTTYAFTGTSDNGFWAFPISGDAMLTQTGDGWESAAISWADSLTLPAGYEPAGRAEYFACDDTYEVWGSGTTLQNSPYEFHFLYAWVLGDFEITARAEHLEPHNTSENVGVMVRAGKDAGAPGVHLKIKGDGRIMAKERLNPGEPSRRFNDAGNATILPNTGDAILRISRRGETISIGVDNLDDDGNPPQFPWLVADGPRPNIPTDRPVMAGLFYNSMVDGVVQSGHFRDVSLSGAVSTDTGHWMLYR